MVSPREAVTELSRAASIPIELRDSPLFETLGRANFEWRDVPVTRALREVCERFGLRAGPARGGGFALTPNLNPQGPAAAGAPPPVPAGGMRFRVHSVRVNEERSQMWTGATRSRAQGRLTLDLAVELGERGWQEIAGFSNTVARDERGTVLAGPERTAFGTAWYFDQMPDEWRGSVVLPVPHPFATRLTWLETDLFGYAKVRKEHLECPLPTDQRPVFREKGALAVAVARAAPPPEREEDPTAELLPGAGGGVRMRPTGPAYYLRVRVPSDLGSALPSEGELIPVAIDASGTAFRGETVLGSSRQQLGNVQLFVAVVQFRGLQDANARLVWDLMGRSEPVRLTRVRLTNIPLPARPITLGEDRPVRPGQTPDSGRRPALSAALADPSGPELELRVEIDGQPVREGLLRVGIAQGDGAAWGPLRWIELPLDSTGTARPGRLRPGRYRLLRVYSGTAAPGPDSARTGAWQNEALEVSAEAGKPLVIPPLRWAPGARPAGTKLSPPRPVPNSSTTPRPDRR